MCRMLAVRTPDRSVRREVLLDFQTQAARSFNGPEDHRSHRDGWGIAGTLLSNLAHIGRSPIDASQDPEYARAVQRSEVVPGDHFILSHVRDASQGSVRLDNSHPFIHHGWAFAHNGTIHGIEAPRDLKPQGDTDSERLFLHILHDYERTGDMGRTLRHILPRIAEQYSHSSLTFLLTDGRTLYAMRRVGPDPAECGTRECQLEYYALGWGKYKGADLVTQEPQLFAGIEHWNEVPDGHLLIIPRVGNVRTVPVFDAPAPVIKPKKGRAKVVAARSR